MENLATEINYKSNFYLIKIPFRSPKAKKQKRKKKKKKEKKKKEKKK